MSEATAHSLSSKQMNFDSKFDELSHKPPSHITQEDARQMQSAEVCYGNDGRSFPSSSDDYLGTVLPVVQTSTDCLLTNYRCFVCDGMLN